MCLLDNYEHVSPAILYIVENIPGPASDDNPESIFITDQYNSQISRHCECSGGCSAAENCPCIIGYGSDNYTKHLSGTLTLNDSKICEPIFECNNLCLCNKNICTNRLIQYGPCKSLEIAEAPENYKNKGFGLFTKAMIIKGSFICEYAGEIITKSEALKRHSKNKVDDKMNYIFCLNEYSQSEVAQTFVDPSELGNIGRYINHSCDPNCHIVPVRIDNPLPKLAIFSLRDIAAGSEITFDYGSHNVETKVGGGRMRCLCGSDNCKQWLPSEDYY